MPAVIREDQIPVAIESLRGYMVACEPISMDPVGFTAEEIAAIQKMRIDKAKIALENIGIQVSQALSPGMQAVSAAVSSFRNDIEQAVGIPELAKSTDFLRSLAKPGAVCIGPCDCVDRCKFETANP